VDRELLQKRLVQAGAWLFVAGMVTGLWVAAVVTGNVTVPIPRLALAAHLNAILGALWLIAVAWTLRFVRYGETGQRRLAWLVGTAAWANWLLTLVASVLGVRGVAYTGDPVNNVVAVLLDVFVVLPSIVGAAAWAWGLGARGSSPPTV
jgi:hydroxylaminobenzene mutase